MPRAKKTTAPKTAAVEVKKETPAEAKKEVAAETKAAAPVEVKAEAPVEEKKPAVKKAAPKKAELAETVHVQYAGSEWTVSELLEKAKAAYAAEGGDVFALSDVQLYVKPEEQKAYYVMNGGAAGSIDL